MEAIAAACTGVYLAGLTVKFGRNRYFSDGSGADADKRITELRAESASLAVEMEKYNSPSTFAQYAKIQRQLNKCEDELDALEATAKQNKGLSKDVASKVMTGLRAALFVVVMFYWRTPVMYFPCTYVYPLDRLGLLFQRQTETFCGLSARLWMIICNGVAAFFLSKYVET